MRHSGHEPGEEIENAINRLEQKRWDAQLDSDSASGELDFLFQEADTESQAGLLREWPPTK